MKTLFIDFDGTLCHDRFWQSLPAEDLYKVQTKLFQENFLMVIDWMLGKYSSEEVNRFIATETSLSYNKLWSAFLHDCSNMHIESGVLDLVSDLRSEYYTVLITDNMDSFDRFTVPALNLTKYFDTIVNSYNEGAIKRDHHGLLFTKYINGDISQSILLENNLDNCELFRKLGGISLYVSAQKNLKEHLIDISKMSLLG